MSNPKKVTLQDLQSILDKNNLSEIEIDVMDKTVGFLLDGHKLSSKRLKLEQAYDWLWAFIEGVRFEKDRYLKDIEDAIDNSCPFEVGDIIRGPKPFRCEKEDVTLLVKEIEDDRMRVDYYYDEQGWPYEVIWPVEYSLYHEVGETK